MRRPNIKQLIVGLLVGLFIVLFIWIIVYFLTTGRVVVTTNNGNVISIFTLNGDGSQKPLKSNMPHILALRLHGGAYIIKVNSKSFATSKVIQVKARKTLRYTLNPGTLSALEPVYPADSSSLAVSNDHLLFIDKGGGLYKIDPQNNLQQISSTNLNYIKWADDSHGVGRDDKNNLYAVNDTSVSQLNVLFGDSSKDGLSIDESSNGQIFVSRGKDIFTGTAAGSFKKIYTAKAPNSNVAATGDKVAILEVPGDLTDKDIKPLVTVVNKSGAVQAKASLDANFGLWSEDGTYLALANDVSKNVVVSSSLGIVANLPARAINSFAWRGHTLYYTSNEELWSYNVTTQTSSLIASMPPGDLLSNLTISSDQSYIYLTVTSNSTDNKSEIYRLGLKNQKVPDYVYQLFVLLPNNTGDCPITYINFTQPTIDVYGSSSNPQQECASSLSAAFDPYGIEIDLLNIKYIETSSDSTD